jgi:hypothetical protein
LFNILLFVQIMYSNNKKPKTFEVRKQIKRPPG